MYCLSHLLLFTCKQDCLQTKYEQSLPVTETYVPTKVHVNILLFLVMGVESKQEGEEENEKILPIIAQYLYDGEDLGHPYIKSTTVLCDYCKHQHTRSKSIQHTFDIINVCLIGLAK